MLLGSNDTSEIIHAVETLLQRFGEDSAYQAAIRANELANRGDLEAAELWRCIERELRARLAASNNQSDS